MCLLRFARTAEEMPLSLRDEYIKEVRWNATTARRCCLISVMDCKSDVPFNCLSSVFIRGMFPALFPSLTCHVPPSLCTPVHRGTLAPMFSYQRTQHTVHVIHSRHENGVCPTPSGLDHRLCTPEIIKSHHFCVRLQHVGLITYCRESSIRKMNSDIFVFWVVIKVLRLHRAVSRCTTCSGLITWSEYLVEDFAHLITGGGHSWREAHEPLCLFVCTNTASISLTPSHSMVGLYTHSSCRLQSVLSNRRGDAIVSCCFFWQTLVLSFY